MKITKLELKNFKRFDDLTIDLTTLSEPAKIVLLIGANGSGKSSVFDGLEVLNKYSKHTTITQQEFSYYKKNVKENYEISFTNSLGKVYSAVSGLYAGTNLGNSFYGRTSIRQVPKLLRTSLGQNQISLENDTDRPKLFIDRDNRFENDIEKVASSILSDVFKGNSSTEQIKESYIAPINIAFKNIFGDEDNTRIKLTSIKPPLEGKVAEILFEKGNSQIPYDFLSSGEKEIFNILLNLLTRKEYFKDTVYFMDEIDLHLNTSLQKNLLKEITENWIPGDCQLWVASHSLGFIEYANEAEHAAIIDFDNLNFDIQQVIYPSQKKNFDVFEIAVSKEFLSKVFEGKRIIFSENKNTSEYNNLNIPDTIFFNAQNRDDVFYKAKNNPGYNGLIDRDYLSDKEREDLLNRYKNLFILDYYSFENYLYHPDNLDEYYGTIGKAFDKLIYRKEIENEKKSVKDKILIKIARIRDSYPFYREEKKDPKLTAFRSNEENIVEMLNSEEFETFYKVLPAKEYGTQIKERQNINPVDLAKTNWFKTRIEAILKK